MSKTQLQENLGLSKIKPIKRLLKGLTKSGGRNNTGRTTVFNRGGGQKAIPTN